MGQNVGSSPSTGIIGNRSSTGLRATNTGVRQVGGRPTAFNASGGLSNATPFAGGFIPGGFTTGAVALGADKLARRGGGDPNSLATRASAVLDPLDLGGARGSLRKQNQIDSLTTSFNDIPEFERITDADGNLRENLRVANAGRDQINRANSALGRLEGLTNFGQATPIAQRLLEVQNTANRQAVNNIAAQQVGQLNQGVGALARQGGISGGARERLAANAFNQGLLARQRQGAADQSARQQIASDDAGRQLSILQNLPGQRQNIANFERQGRAIDVGNAVSDIRGASQDRTARAGSLAQATASIQNAPRGGLAGIVDGVLGK